MRYFKLFVETNITLALASVFLSLASAFQLGAVPRVDTFLLLLFCGTFLAYNVHHLSKFRSERKIQQGDYAQWVNQHKKIFLGVMGFTAFLAGIAMIYMNPKLWLPIVLISMIALAYSFPIVSVKEKLEPLRRVPYVKIWLICCVWSFATVNLPVLQWEIAVTTQNLAIVFIERMVFLFALAILFDIRDMDSDLRKGLRTLPLLMGRSTSFWIATFLLILFMVTCWVHYYFTSGFLTLAMIISATATLVAIRYTKENSMSYFHYRIYDGSLLIQPVLVIAFYYLEKSGL